MNLLTPYPRVPWKAVLIGLAAIVVFAGAVHLASGPARRAASQAKADTHVADTRAGTAAGATRILDQAHAAAAASQDLTRETADVLDSMPGADQPLDPRLNRAGRERLRLREAYRSKAAGSDPGGEGALQRPDSR